MVSVLFPVQDRTGALLVLFTAEDDFDDFCHHILGAGGAPQVLTIQCVVLSSSQQRDRVGPSYSCDRYQVKSDIAADCRCGVGWGGAASHAPSHWRHRTRPHSSV